MTAPRTSRLGERARSLGEPVASAGNRPIRLDDAHLAWFVERGEVDVFLVEHEDGEPISSARHLLRAGQGSLVFGVGEHLMPVAAVAKGLPQCALRRVRIEALLEQGDDDELAAQVDAWLSQFAAAVARRIELRPPPDVLLTPGESADAAAGCVLSTRLGGVVWAAAEDGAAAYLGTETPGETGTGLVPLTAETWATFQVPARVAGCSSRALIADGRLLQALAEFHDLAIGADHLNHLLSLADEANEQVGRAAHRRMDEEQARRSLFNVLGSRRPPVERTGSALLAALELIGEREGIAFRPARRRRAAADPSLQDVLNASGVRGRKVRLAAEDRWWLGDSGAMLGFRREDGRPMALLIGMTGRYRAVDPVSGRSVRLDADRAAEIAEDAWAFYRPLPTDRAATVGDLLRLAGKSMAADFVRFAVAGVLSTMLLLAPAVVIGILADWVIPSSAGSMLAQFAIALVAFALVGVLLQMLQGTAMMRLEGRATARVGAALWDRALGLPTSFFRSFTAGELAVRMAAFQALRDNVSGVVANALLSLLFLLPALGLLFVYDAALAWASLGIAFIALTATALLGLLQMAPQRRRYAASRRLASELFQFINGMSKLRSAGAESSAFASWARGYREQHAAVLQAARLNDYLVAFSIAAPAFVAATLFGVALWQRGDAGGITVGEFLVAYSVSLTFFTAVASLGRSFGAIAAIVPGYEQVKPLLAARPDTRTEGDAVVELSGDVHLDHVSFRYAEDGPLILDDVSIHARPGEFVAIVGESGAGKSTLMRLTLGLEEPSAGGIYFDGKGLAHLDRNAVRRQIGVVIQDGALQPGNILDNIIGVGDDLTIDDAWRAARLAAVDEDLAAMPMGMFTAVSDSSATFSGGQAQRIRIATALVRNPRIVFLDEATSWLDAKSQAKVMQGIESLAVTRIVIAHRLSTIRKAERIYVLHGGRVVQEGSFDELSDGEGLFRELVRRQMA